MKSLAVLFLFILSVFIFSQTNDKDIIYQVSNLNSLAAGLYDGEENLSSLKEHGDFGIGTFNKLDGEMILLDNKFYQVNVQGKVILKPESELTPFSNVTFFDADTQLHLSGINDFKSLQTFLDDMLPTKNIFYAFRIDGDFEFIKTRSVPQQFKPYPPLVEVTKKQATFEFKNVKGTILGFRFPSYITGINMPGYHFHFITDDKSGGGHLLECSLNNSSAKIDFTREIIISLPQSKEFDLLNMESDRQDELKKAEK